MIKNGILTIFYCIFFPLGDSRCWMFAGAHGFKATCFVVFVFFKLFCSCVGAFIGK